jgi:Ca2+-binding EF-hand superfamily protein
VFWQGTQRTYEQAKDAEAPTLAADIDTLVREDCAKAYTGPLSTLGSPQKEAILVRLIALFLMRRADIGYAVGMASLMAFSLHIFPSENAAFGVFCYVVERLFPINYFSKADREVCRYAEYRTFALLAERLRPRLVQPLKAIFRPQNSSVIPIQTREFDFSPFVTTLKRTAETWFSTLFASSLYPSDLMRVWDCAFIYGFEFIHKLGLTLLSKYQRLLRNTIKQETASLKQGNSVDALMTAGNLARLKLVKRCEKQPIEKMLKKALNKASYTAITRIQYYAQAVSLESNLKERLTRLRISKSLFREQEMTIEDLRRLFDELNRLKMNDRISRKLFVTTLEKSHSVAEKTALNLFVTFDQTGSDFVPVQELLLGLATLSRSTLEEKLMLYFMTFDEEKSGALDPRDVIKLILTLEKVLDIRSSSFAELRSGLFLDMSRTTEGKIALDSFVKSFKETQSTRPILELLMVVEAEDSFDGIEMRLVDFARIGDFSEIHSPLTSSDIATPVSEEHDADIPDPEDLEARLESILANDLREGEKMKAEENLFEGVEDNMQRLLEEDEERLFGDGRLGGVDDGVQVERKQTMKKAGIDYMEEYKVESEGNRGDIQSEGSLLMMKKDEGRKNGCSRFCTREMCRLS